MPAGYVFNDNNGKEWQTKVEAMINSTGQALVDVSCTEYGPVNAASNTITIIPRAINGLDRVTNAESALPGREAETRTDFEVLIPLESGKFLNESNGDSKIACGS